MNNKKILILGEILLTVVLSILLIIKITKPWSTKFNIHDFYSNYGHLEETEWQIYETQEIPANENILEGPYLHLNAGSYTLELDYLADAPHTNVYIFAYNNLKRVHANTIELRPNQNKVVYNFYITGKVDGFNLRFLYSGEGNLSFYGGNITETSTNIRLMLFVLLIIITIVNIYCFTDVIQTHKEIIVALSTIILVSAIPVFSNGIIVGFDGNFHLMRIEGLIQGILDGNFPVKMETTLNDGFGYPVPVFYGSSLLYIAAMLRIIGFSVSSAYKGYILFINILTVLVTYICGKQIFKKQKTALMSTAVYVTAGYRLINIYVCNSVGEYSAFIFLPIIVLAIWKMYVTDKIGKHSTDSALLLSGGMLGLLFTHILTTEITCIVLFINAIILFRTTFRKKTILTYLQAIGIVTIGGIAFYIPFIDYYIKVNTFIKNVGNEVQHIQHYGASIADYFLFFKKVTGIRSYNEIERMQLTPGFLLMLGLILGIYLIYTHKSSKQITYCVCGSGFMLFMASNIFPWNLFAGMKVIGPILTSVQTPCRYIDMAIVFLWLLYGLVIEKMESNNIISYNRILIPFSFSILIMVSIFTSSLFQNMNQVEYIDRVEIPRYTYSSFDGHVDQSMNVGGSEYLIYGTVINNLKYTLVSENVTANIEYDKGTDMVITVVAPSNGWIDLPRFNYPYYHAVDIQGKEFPIQNGVNNSIRIVFNEPYNGTIQLNFIKPFHWIISEIITGLFFIIFPVIIWINKFKKVSVT